MDFSFERERVRLGDGCTTSFKRQPFKKSRNLYRIYAHILFLIELLDDLLKQRMSQDFQIFLYY